MTATYIAITSEYGIVIRRDALAEKGVSLEAVLQAFETSEPLDSNEALISFGPHFGGEALDEFCSRLTVLGLVYFDDFFEFVGDYPHWCSFRVSKTSKVS